MRLTYLDFHAAAGQVWDAAAILQSGHPFFTNAPVLRNRVEDWTRPGTGELNSTPDRQFEYQMEAEIDHLQRLPSQTKESVGCSDLHAAAKKSIKERWKNWGIWNDNWIDVPGPRWKHEEPLETCHEKDPAEVPSRPYSQFLFQLEYERQVMLRGGLDIATPDINTIAAEKVRRSWHNQRIWNHEWKEIPGLMWKHEKYPHVWTKNTRRESPKPPCKATTQAMPTKRAQSRGGSTNQHRPELHATGPDIVPSQSSTPLSLRLQELGSAGLLPEPDFNTQATLSTKPAVDTQIQQRPPVQSTRTPTTVPKQRGKLCLLWEKFTGSM
jgi:hypothetical protein